MKDPITTLQDFLKRYTYNSLKDKIGEGSFGKVFKALDTETNTYMAIKVAEVKYLDGKRFSLHDEWKTLKKVSENPYFVQYETVYSFVTPQGEFDYAVMKYYPHGNLRQYLSSNSLTFAQKIELVKEIGKGISILHQNNIVHRDIKPANILLETNLDDDVTLITGIDTEKILAIKPVIADFGLSKITTPNDRSLFSGSFAGGTLQYSSPEQLLGKELRLNTDIWSFGVLSYEIFTGKPLFEVQKNENHSRIRESDLTRQILHLKYANKLKALPIDVKKMVSDCLVRDPEKRVKDVSSVLQLLEPSNVKTRNSSILDYMKNNIIWILTTLCFVLISFFLLIDNSKKESEIHDNQAEIDSLVNNNGDLNDSNQRLTDELEVTNNKLNEIDSQVSNLTTKISKLESSGEADQKTINKLKSDLKNLNSEKEKITNELEKQNKKDRIRNTISTIVDQMVKVQGGYLQMGSTNYNESPIHRVTISNFRISKYEITNKQWAAVMGIDTEDNTNYTNYPKHLSWNDLQIFLDSLNRKSNLNFRLPSEAEWEYAAKGGNNESFIYSGTSDVSQLSNYANFCDVNCTSDSKDVNTNDKFERTAPVGNYSPNILGLFDMSGNVREWCEDDWHENYVNAPINGIAWVDAQRSQYRVTKGGSFWENQSSCRVAWRTFVEPGSTFSNIGFRLVLSN